jgi:hypothetical protein
MVDRDRNFHAFGIDCAQYLQGLLAAHCSVGTAWFAELLEGLQGDAIGSREV